jgi:hypothetical protein
MALEFRIASKMSPSLPVAGSCTGALSAGLPLFFCFFFFPSWGFSSALRFRFVGIASAIAAAIARRTTASALEPLKSLFGGAERPNDAEQNRGNINPQTLSFVYI